MRRKLVTTASVMLAMSLAFTGCSSSSDKSEDNKDNNVKVESQDNKDEGEKVTKPEAKGTIEYAFDDSVKDKAGYAQGTVTFSADKKGTYNLYWCNDTETLPGYYEISSLELANDNDKATVEFGYHVAIPADATKMIAVAAGDKDSYKIEEAVAVYELDSAKQLKSENAIYTFSSISDVHIDQEKWGATPGYWWEYSEDHWAKCLAYSVDKKVDFIASSGDQVTNAKIDTLDKEWQSYQYILAQSDYVNPIYECGGNHEVRQDGQVADELVAYIKGSGLDNNIDTIKSGQTYYYITEPKTGDLFIFMSLEGGYKPSLYDEFTTKQLDWLEGILKENYGKGKNIYIVQHAFIKGYGAGDSIETPYYAGSLSPNWETSKRFISLLEQYKDVVWISGHSHEDFSLGYNYSDNNGTSCKMVHNSSVANPTTVVNNAISYDFHEEVSQGYLVQTFENAIVFNGVNYVDAKVYPLYSYIMDGQTSKQEAAAVEEPAPVEGATAGNLRSVIAHAYTVLGLTYEYSSYDQYQSLKKLYYEYKDVDVDEMTEADICKVYAQFQEKILSATAISKMVSIAEITAETVEH